MHLENLISGSYSVVNVQSITLLPASILKVQVLHPYQPGKMLPKSLKDCRMKYGNYYRIVDVPKMWLPRQSATGRALKNVDHMYLSDLSE